MPLKSRKKERFSTYGEKKKDELLINKINGRPNYNLLYLELRLYMAY